MPDARTEERIREIDRRVAELDALLAKQQDATISNNGGSDPRIKSQDEMIYWAIGGRNAIPCWQSATDLRRNLPEGLTVES
jgi:hypothetical protein